MRDAIRRCAIAGLVALVGCEEDPVSKAVPSIPQAPEPSKKPPAEGEHAVSMACQFAVQLPHRRITAPKPPQIIDQIATQDDVHKVMASASCSDLGSVDSTAEMLDVVSTGMAMQLGGKEVARREIQWLGRPGIEVVINVPEDRSPPGLGWGGNLDVRFRLVSSGLRVYQLIVMQAAANDDVETVAKTFFESLELRGEPSADTKREWTRQRVGDFSIEAPGTPQSYDDKPPEAVEAVRFEHGTGKTGYSMRIWKDHLPPNDLSPSDHLQAFFLVEFRTDDIEILTTEDASVGDWPAVDVHYRPNVPVQEGVSDIAKKMIEERKLGFFVRLVDVGEQIVELRVNDRERDDRVKHYFDSLESAESSE